jgi:hypothetical protein
MGEVEARGEVPIGTEGQVMRLPRMTTRRWLMTVALIAVGLAGPVMLLRRTFQLRELAISHQREAEKAELTTYILMTAARGQSEESSRADLSKAPAWLSLADHHRAMESKYRYAACYPWLPVAPDPPEPE